VTETYVCSRCEATVTRSFEIRSLIRTCGECGENGRFLHESLVDSLGRLPREELPEDWETMALDERFKQALREGLIQITRE
jgi:DNA-directed RNA polymerase subunit RPC12/RpoP